MKKNIFAMAMGIVLWAAMAAAPVQAVEIFEGLDLNVKIAQHFQSVEADSSANAIGGFDPGDTNAAFMRPRFNLELSMQFTPWLSAFVELAEEPNDFGGDFDPFSIENDLTFLDVSLLKAIDRPLADKHMLTLRLGTPVGTLWNFRGYSDGAAVQGNPLIGNTPFDPVDAFTGAQILATHEIGGVIESAGWDIAALTGNFNEDTRGDRGTDINIRGRVSFSPGLSVGAGFVTTDNEDGATSAFFNGNGDNVSMADRSSPSGRETHFAFFDDGGNPQAFGVESDAWQIDGKYAFQEQATIRAWYARAEEDTNGLELSNIGLEGQFYVIPDVYVAARYSIVENETPGIGGDDTLERAQIGGGVWLWDNTLIKVEYIRQTEEANARSNVGDDWDGVLVELSTSL
jgi:hypothetical protein